MSTLPVHINFPEEEIKILSYWKEIDAFSNCLEQSKNKPRFVFFDGPPFATGLPHYGHLLAGTIKDIVTRYAHAQGFHVPRRFGWDTHGLPVEHEIDKLLNIKSVSDVEKIGIKAYNAECRKIVMRYSSEWESTIERLGRWIDFKNDYKTLYPSYMESLWWVFKQLWTKGFIYQGFRVMPYSTGCTTPISNFEASQNYKDVTEDAVTITFPIVGDENGAKLIAWTTTPWTLPSNLALCVNPDFLYVKVKVIKTQITLICLEDRLAFVFKSETEYEVLEKFLGERLKGLSYEPLFPYFSSFKSKGAFRVLTDKYVTSESGTGIVHQAPYFGEDDYRVCLAAGVISAGTDNIVCPIDESGRFIEPVKDFLGVYVKDADKGIIKYLKEKDRLFSVSKCKHSYPYCWRSDTPLLYRAVPSWFMRVQHMTDKLLEKNATTHWVPSSLKDGRFGNWLREARDWNLSRNRYWGTPIPLWSSQDSEEYVCIGSLEELERLSGVSVCDLHRDSIDHITIPSSRPGVPPLRRIPEVFDCWFESGSMPYAQVHYPFENKKEFEENFPADFIAEGADQTRGWFYTLLVLSSALFDKPPFKNVIVNGMVLASDGQKMSKRLKNYPDPLDMINKYGADALRFYLINSPVVKGESLRFKEEGVKDIVKDAFLPWFNALRFLNQVIESYCREKGAFLWSASSLGSSSNIMDKWIISFTMSLLIFVRTEMAAYRLYTVLPKLNKFIDNLTNTYVRMNRRRLKGTEGNDEDQLKAIQTLFYVLLTMVKVFAPFTPFLTETMFQNLRSFISDSEDRNSSSVHYLMQPSPLESCINENIERAVCRMQNVIDVGRILRDRRTLPVKYPLSELVIIHQSPTVLSDIESLEQYIQEELNVKKVTLSSDKNTYGVQLRGEPDHKNLGGRLKNAFKSVSAEIKTLSDEKLSEFMISGKMEIQGFELFSSDIRILYSFDKSIGDYEAASSNELLVLLNTSQNESLKDEGTARELVNRIQKLRKKGNCTPMDDVTLYYRLTPKDSDLSRIILEYKDIFESQTKSPLRPLFTSSKSLSFLASDTFDLKETTVEFSIGTGFPSDYLKVVEVPIVPFVNVVHQGKQGVVFLANPITTSSSFSSSQLSIKEFKEEVFRVFGLKTNSEIVKFYVGDKVLETIELSLSGQTIYVESPGVVQSGGPCCKFVNIKSSKYSGSLLLENPIGESLCDCLPELSSRIFESFQWIDAQKNRIRDLKNFVGKTVYLEY